MGRRLYLNKLVLRVTLIIVVFTASCEPPKEQELIDEANFNFENAVFEMGLDKLPFKGPVERKSIEEYPPKPRYSVYGWYYIYKKDTVWVYAEVDTLLEGKTRIHFSKNLGAYIEELDRRRK